MAEPTQRRGSGDTRADAPSSSLPRVRAGTRRAVVAADAVTGEMIWMHSINEGKRGESAPRQLSGRGLSSAIL